MGNNNHWRGRQNTSYQDWLEEESFLPIVGAFYHQEENFLLSRGSVKSSRDLMWDEVKMLMIDVRQEKFWHRFSSKDDYINKKPSVSRARSFYPGLDLVRDL